jgi:glycosyltransferase involved in cell wall biosynthesis
LRVAVCADFREEGWPSMDRVADALMEYLARDHAETIEATLVAPPFRRRASRLLPGHVALNIDRGLNRLVDYPRHVREIGARYDVFHVVDHSYSQLVHSLPASRTVVTCHDLDAFRAVLDPADENRSPPFKAMTRHILGGFTRAACIACDTAAVRAEVATRLAPGARLVVAPVGVDHVFSSTPDRDADVEAGRLIRAPSGALEILHVGSTVARKRIATVLQTVARLARAVPEVHLVRVGGRFTPEQQRLVGELGLSARISALPPLDDRTLAAVYRRAALVVLPSEREGFGLPVVEAMACGTRVIASDLPVLREVAGGLAEYCDPSDIECWVRAATRLLAQGDRADERRAREAWARRFSWSTFAATMAGIYEELGHPDAARTPSSEACLA